MTPEEARKKLNLTPEQIDEMAKPYENGTYAHEDRMAHAGCHIDQVGKKRITVVFDAADTQQVNRLAESKGVKPSSVYREALKFYLSKQVASI